MKKKKKHSIKVAKNSNHSGRARPISDSVSCDSLCSASSNDNTYKTSLCTAIKSIQSTYNTYSAMISGLYDSAKGNAKQAPLTVIIDIFSDFLTLYKDCSANVTFLNKDFCTTINWGGCNPSDVLVRSNLNALLNKGSKAMTNFIGWDTLYAPNMKAMLFSNVSGSGKSFAQALTDLGTPGSPAANPFLSTDQQTDLSTGMSGVDPNTGAPAGAPTFNFETNFSKIYDNINKLVSEASECSPLHCTINGTSASNCVTANECVDLSQIINKDNTNDVTTSITSLSVPLLRISSIKVTNASSISSLTYLNLESNNISDISPLVNLTNLSNLTLTGNKISDILPLFTLEMLSTIYADSNNISKIPQIAAGELSKLSDLSLNGNSIRDITYLTSLSCLSRLDLGSNSISDISPLSELTNLTRLNLSQNQIITVKPLSALTKQSLFLNLCDNKKITDLGTLSKLTNLTSLIYCNNFPCPLKNKAACNGCECS